MIDLQQAVVTLRARYPKLEAVSDRVYRGMDLHEGRPYAVRYFDLRDAVPSSIEGLQGYQDEVLSGDYYAAEAKADLRWNYYLYFVANSDRFKNDAFLKAKAIIEADREYARKIVVEESLLEALIARTVFEPTSDGALPPDALSIWVAALDRHSLGFVVDDSLQVPDVVKNIIAGNRQGRQRSLSAPSLTAGEAAAATDFLARVEIQGFRAFPKQRTFNLGLVNLISGVNGVGKTSTLEAIEFLFCGKTKRTDKPVLQNTTITGTWATSGMTLNTGRSTSAAQFRARQLAWYGRTELRKLTLDDSFGKFNFLDTDAAVKLTVENSFERLTDDVFQLLLGAESSKALDRLDRVAKQLNDAERSIEKDVGTSDIRRTDALRRVEEIRAAPHESDAFWADVAAALRRLGWRGSVEKADAVALSDELVKTMTNARLLPTTAMPTALVVEWRAAAEALRGVSRTLGELAQEGRRTEAEAKRVRSQLRVVTERLAAIEALQPLVRAGVAVQWKQLDALKARYAEASTRLASLELSAAEIPEEAAKEGLGIRDAVRRWSEFLDDAAQEKDGAQRRLATLESAQTILTNARQQLRSGALAVIEHTNDTKHCPVCGTAFTAAKLKALVDALVAGDGISVIDSDHVRRDVEAAENKRLRADRALEALRSLQRFTEVSDAVPVATCLAQVADERGRVSVIRAELETMEETIKAQASLGWTVDRVRALSETAGVSAEVSDAELGKVAEELTKERGALTNRVSELERDARTREARLSDLSAAYNFPSAMSLVAMQKEGAERVRTAEQVVTATKEIDALLDLASASSVEGLRAGLEQTHDLVVRLRTAIQREADDDQSLTREATIAGDAAKEIEAYQVRLNRVNSARQVIDDLTRGQSGRLLAEQVLRENASSIASTFEKIHAPNEFDVQVDGTADDTLRIVRRSTGRKVELDEMSSGQRAAYALSLFLAMNERLRTGPRVLIFDDPVSHVDDINTLSFLDHLRDISLTRMRQIFFATADTKLAGLLVRKFGFLGGQFKHIELEREG